ncbi:RICIN domain-containing protein [Dactylosporangium sp. NPDC049742]|uniref:RICIN domain-containing protein n=1 Tax=Dactylosporangium sp. NPDC049742 TaxID=3154737 RepID=UPI0034349C8F
MRDVLRRLLLSLVVAVAVFGVAPVAPAAAAPDPPVTTGGNLRNAHTGKCLGVANGLAGSWTCTKGRDQLWHQGNCPLEKPGYCQVVNGNGQCLAVDGGEVTEGRRVWGFPCSGTDDQYWTALEMMAGQIVNFVNYRGTWQDGEPDYVLAVYGRSMDNGAPVVIWRYHPEFPDHTWSPEFPWQ